MSQPHVRTDRPLLRAERLEDRTVPAVSVVFDYTYDASGFFNDAARRAVLQSTADAIGSRLDDGLLAVGPSSGNSWNAVFADPSSGAQLSRANMTVGANQVVVFVGGRNFEDAEAGLASVGGFSATGSTAFLNTVTRRGQGASQGSVANDFAPWGGSIAFDADQNWDFSGSADVPANRLSFSAVATHELGHIFGLGTSDSWFNRVSNGAFVGASTLAANGGAYPAVSGERAHWRQGTVSDGRLAAMNPIIQQGEYRSFSSLDFAALRDIGWQVGGAAASKVDTTPTVSPAAQPSAQPQATGPTRLFATGTDAGSAPHVKVYNADGSLRFSFFAYDAAFTNGVRVATGDLNGDGVDDIAVVPARGGLPHVKMFDGRTGGLMAAFWASDPATAFGTSLAIGDIDGNGSGDIITGAGAGTSPLVRSFDTGGRLLGEFHAYDPAFLGGVTLSAGDLNGDGRAEIVTGTGNGGVALVRAFDGRSSAVLRELYAFPANFFGGVSVAVGDLDGDGAGDLIATPGFGGAPAIQAYSGRDSSTILSLSVPVATLAGLKVAAKQVSATGPADLFVSTGFGVLPSLLRYRGGTLIGSAMAYDPAFLGGFSVG